MPIHTAKLSILVHAFCNSSLWSIYLSMKVETTQEIRDQEMIPEILDRVEKLVDFALDVVDMAEECRDPDIPY